MLSSRKDKMFLQLRKAEIDLLDLVNDSQIDCFRIPQTSHNIIKTFTIDTKDKHSFV